MAQAQAAPWRGAGGRWLVWVLRVVAWLVLIVIGYRGVTAIITSETGSGPPASVGASAHSAFPIALAEAYATQFGEVYLNASPAAAGARASQLAAFLPAGADPQLGWNGAGVLRLQSEQVAGIAVRDPHHAVVTLLARVNGNLMELGVPIYTSGAGMVVTGEPAWLPPPARASAPSPPTVTADPATQSVLGSQLPAFFQAYASGNQVTLARFLAPGTAVAGLSGQVSFGSLTSLTVPAGGRTRQVIATVLWHVATAVTRARRGQPVSVTQPVGIEVSYALTVVKRSGAWYIASIRPSTQPAGQP